MLRPFFNARGELVDPWPAVFAACLIYGIAFLVLAC